jgi:hypothetical protein
MAKVYPTLNGNGYARDIGTICDEVFSASLLARHRQSDLYFGNIASLDYLMKEFNNKPQQLADAVADMYTKLFTRVFDSATATCNVEEDPTTNTATIVLEITGKHDGMNFSVGHEVETRDGMFVKTIKRLNGDNE